VPSATIATVGKRAAAQAGQRRSASWQAPVSLEVPSAIRR